MVNQKGKKPQPPNRVRQSETGSREAIDELLLERKLDETRLDRKISRRHQHAD